MSKAPTLADVRALCGYIEDGSDTKVSISQDDATRTWLVMVGKATYYGATFSRAVEAALAAMKETDDE